MMLNAAFWPALTGLVAAVFVTIKSGQPTVTPAEDCAATPLVVVAVAVLSKSPQVSDSFLRQG